MICPIDQTGYCSFHGRRHIGHAARLAVEDSEKAERIRRLWDGKRPPDTPERLSLFRRTTNYVKERAAWESAGRPLVPPEVRTARRAQCDSCKYHDPVKDTCTACGCSLHKTLLGDKLGWATTFCPKGKWSAWTEPPPAAPTPPPFDADWPAGTEPAFLNLAAHVEGMSPVHLTLSRLSSGIVQAWGGQGSAPVWGRTALPCDGCKPEWHSPFDWSASIYRYAHDGPLKRFVLSLERFTPEHAVFIVASKLALLSLTPFLAVGQGVMMCGEQGAAYTPVKALALAPWSITVTEGPA